MASIKNRALTIATVGLLSATPVTIATHGLIQLEIAAPPAAVTQAPRAYAGGPSKIELDYAISHIFKSDGTIYLLSDTRIEFESAALELSRKDSHATFILHGSADVYKSTLYEIHPECKFVLTSNSVTERTQPGNFKPSPVIGIDSNIKAVHWTAKTLSYKADTAFRIKSSPDYLIFTKAPEIALQPASYAFTTQSELALNNNASAKFLPSEAVSYVYAGDLSVQVEGQAAFHYAQSGELKHISHAMITMDLESRYFIERLSRIPLDDDEEVLMLFVNALLESDEDY